MGKNAEFPTLAAEYAEIVKRDPCSYCNGASEVPDHIVAVSMGGELDWWNLTGACEGCNGPKWKKSLLLWMLER